MGVHKEMKSKMCRACCCLTFLLIINCWLLLHISGEVGMISWVLWSGEYQTNGDTYLFVPGGGNALCNDLCVNLCVYDDTQCEITNCLNSCANQLIKDGNNDVIRHNYSVPPPNEGEELIFIEGGFEIDIEIDYVWDIDMETTEEPIEDDMVDEAIETDGGLETPLFVEDGFPVTMETTDVAIEDGTTGNPKLDDLRTLLLKMADNINTLKTQYETDCVDETDVNYDECTQLHNKIDNLIEMFKAFEQSWNNVAIEFHLEITVEVWLDVVTITTSP